MPLVLLVLIIAVALAARSAPQQDLGDQFVPPILRRNFRQNNPFNVGPNPDRSNPWRGQLYLDDRGLPVFDTMDNGLRAGAIDVLGSFVREPHLDLLDFGEEYAPYLHNPPARRGDYGRSLALTLRVAAGDDYNAKSRTNFVRLLDAIIVNENTDNPLSAAQMERAADAARAHFRI